MIPRPPRSTLFPTRRSSDLGRDRHAPQRRMPPRLARHRFRHRPVDAGLRREAVAAPRSEEHTSELQSRVDLVCRLLLEKKKKLNRAWFRSISATAQARLATD